MNTSETVPLAVPTGETSNAPSTSPMKNSSIAPKTKNPKTKSTARAGSKQERVIKLLRRSEGVTVQAVMKATGWQKHSVHGFFAGVVRKKLRLNLVNEKINDQRVYRIITKGRTKAARKSSGKRAG